MSLVDSFTHLKDRPGADQALPLLQRIASLVKPIMKKHGWRLPLLAEFFPENPALVGLNVNGGQKILLRLRPPHSPSTFYEEEQIVLVMLHELTHNVHGPHNQDFYKYLSGLEAEWDELKRTGYNGEGFHSMGKRLGVGISHNLPPYLARSKALEAAEKRRKQSQSMGSSGRLGGRSVNKSMRELAAEAAERRAKDDKVCGSGLEAQREVERAAQESIEHNAISVTVDSDDDDIQIIVPSTSTSSNFTRAPPARTISSQAATGPDLPRRPSDRPERNNQGIINIHQNRSRQQTLSGVGVSAPSLVLSAGEWSCPTCTLINNPLILQCLVCDTVRPQMTKGWNCLTCGEVGMDHDFWTCRYCGAVKTDSSGVVS